jgi:hypothetical protein
LHCATLPQSTVHIENSVLFSLINGVDDSHPGTGDVALSRCTFWAPEPHYAWRDRLGNTLMNIYAWSHSRFTIEDCYFAAPEAHLSPIDFQNVAPPLPWQGRRNVYATPFGFYVGGRSDPNCAENWAKFVELEEGSFDDDPILFDPRFWKLVSGTPGIAANPDGNDVGADTRRIAIRSPLPAP